MLGNAPGQRTAQNSARDGFKRLELVARLGATGDEQRFVEAYKHLKAIGVLAWICRKRQWLNVCSLSGACRRDWLILQSLFQPLKQSVLL
jgi:hypothetical protein